MLSSNPAGETKHRVSTPQKN